MINRANAVKKMLSLVGRDAVIVSDTMIDFAKAVIYPLRYKNKLYVELQPSDVGCIDDGCYMYIGEADVTFTTDDRVEVGTKKFVPQRVESMEFGGQPVYTWAILRPCVGD